MNAAELKTLIESDEVAASHFAAGRDFQCAQRCSEIAPKLRVPVAAADIQYASALSGAWAKIKLAREADETPPEIKGVCITFLDWIKSERPIDFDLPQVQAMLGGLVLSSLVSQGEAAEMSELANQPQTITTDEVSACRT